jgi:hypothetical protein
VSQGKIYALHIVPRHLSVCYAAAELSESKINMQKKHKALLLAVVVDHP